ncbi:MAG: hypothetical protein ACJ8CB_01975, partial [Ktedonobacteraceae bacterium]
IGQLGLSQLEELLGVGMQFEFGSDDLFHRTSLPEFHAFVNRRVGVKVCAKESPRREAGGLLGADVEHFDCKGRHPFACFFRSGAHI